MRRFITLHVDGEPYSIAIDYIAGFEDNTIFVKRDSHFLIKVQESHEEIQNLINNI